MHSDYAIGQPAPLLRLVPWLIVGIIVADATAIDYSPWLLVAVVALAVAVCRQPWAQSLCLGLCTLVFGLVLTSRERRQMNSEWGGGWQTLQGVVASEPVVKARSVAVDFIVTDSHEHLKAYLQTDERSRSLMPGDGLVLSTRVSWPDSARAGSRFDYRRYLQVHGYAGQCYADGRHWQTATVSWQKLPRADRLKLRALRWRHRLLRQLRTLAPDDDRAYGVLAAMTLGDKSALDKELRQTYSNTGAAHVLALSGLHMGILYYLLTVLTFFGRRTLLSRLLTIVLFWTFALLTGLSPSVVRSALMLSLAALLSLRGGGSASVNVLCLAAIIMLVANPYTLFDVGFQLSFLAVFSILLFMPVLDGLWPQDFLLRHPVCRLLWSLVAVGVAAQAGTAPLVAYHFGQLPLYFVVTNLVAIPCVYMVLWLCVAWLLLPVPLLGSALTTVVGWLNTALSHIAAWPHASWSGLSPSVLQTTMTYVIIVSLWCAAARLRRTRRYWH